jgi:hypothetical protein
MTLTFPTDPTDPLFARLVFNYIAANCEGAERWHAVSRAAQWAAMSYVRADAEAWRDAYVSLDGAAAALLRF